MNLITRYLSLHAQEFAGAFGRVLHQPFASLMTIAVIAIALALPSGFRVMVNNARVLSGSWEAAVDFTVYLEMSVDDESARTLARDIEARDDVSRVALVNRTDALADFRAYSGFGEALDVLEENPLPHALVVRPDGGAQGNVAALARALDAMDETALVQLDTEWVERLRSILELARRLADIATVLLSLAVIVVIGNTIRLEINNRRNEIEVIKLVGGSNGYVRRPFLYLGFCHGLAGGIVAAITIGVGLSLISSPARSLAQLYDSGYRLVGLSVEQTALLLGSGAILGWAGAAIATARHLHRIEPT
jgi:cell division transport system permease protein